MEGDPDSEAKPDNGVSRRYNPRQCAHLYGQLSSRVVVAGAE